MAKTPRQPAAIRFGFDILPKVSRSFAFITKELASDKRSRIGDAVMVFYLVCRILDTVEDSDLARDRKAHLYGSFLDRLASLETDITLGPVIDRLAHDGYRELLHNAPRVIAAYADLDGEARRVILRRAREMAAGMDSFSGRNIETFEDLDAYCHPVAVVVGYGLTELFHHYGHIPDAGPESMRLAREFGLFLQKVNITRDYGQDHACGRHFWPQALLHEQGLCYDSIAGNRHAQPAMAVLDKMIENTRGTAEGALAYTLTIPPSERAVRYFCGVSLFLALRTLARIDGNPDVFVADPGPAPASLKVPRRDLASMLLALKRDLRDDRKLVAAFRQELAGEEGLEPSTS